jgi:sortase A
VSDRRPIDQIPTEELERILAIRKRKERAQRLRRLAVQGRIVESGPSTQAPGPDGQVPVLDAAGRPTGRYRSIEVGGEEELPPEEKPVRRGIAWGWVFNKLLLLVEISVVLGLIAILVSSFLSLRELNQSVKESLTPSPTETPRPLIDVVVLPSGHRPPTAPGVVEPNLDEIPEHLRGLVQAVTPLPIPTQGPEQPSRIIIKSIAVDAPVVEGDDWEQLKKGVGHHLRSANPGERGNMVLSAHNDVFGEIFRDLDKVELKDEILVYSGSRVFRYVATQKRVIEPTEVSVMYPTSDPTLTLITCYPYLVDNKRIVVIAELQP